jgi:hypothetical protein
VNDLSPAAVQMLWPVLQIIGLVVAGVGGLVFGLWRGWQAVIGQIRDIIGEHEVKEEKWQKDIAQRLTRLERQVGGLRDHLISADIIEVTGSHSLGEDDTKP